MLNSGKKNFSRNKKKYFNSRVVRKNILNEAKNHNPPPPCKLNGRSLIGIVYKRGCKCLFPTTSSTLTRCPRL